MNERIKELACQAKLEDPSFPFGQWDNPELEKFAELIVQECIDYCGENLSKTVGGALKIHFGIER